MRRQALFVTMLSLAPAVAFGGFRVSSFQKETKLGANYWNAAAAVDSNMQTAWRIDPEHENIGEWIEIDLPKGTVDKVGMVIGWQDGDRFTDFARVKKGRVQVYTEADGEKVVLEHDVEFEDKQGMQIVDLPDTAVGDEFSGGRLRLTVTEVYDGKDYPSLAVSEVLVVLQEMDAPTTIAGTPPSEEDDHLHLDMLDGDAKTFWASADPGAGQTFKLNADGYGISSLGIHPGPKDYARPKTLEVVVNDQPHTFTLEDKEEMQWIQLPPMTGYTGSVWGWVNVTVKDTYEGKKPGVAIREATLKATNYEGL